MAAFIPKKSFPISQMVGERLAATRAAKRHSQESLSKATGYTQSKIARAESGICPITVDTLVTLCRALGQDPAALLADDYSIRL